MPRAFLASLVVIEPVPHSEFAVLEGPIELKVDRSVVNRVSANDEQSVDLHGIHVARQAKHAGTDGQDKQMGECAWTLNKKCAVEATDALGPPKVINLIEWFTERGHRRSLRTVPAAGIVLIPLRLRILGEQTLDL